MCYTGHNKASRQTLLMHDFSPHHHYHYQSICDIPEKALCPYAAQVVAMYLLPALTALGISPSGSGTGAPELLVLGPFTLAHSCFADADTIARAFVIRRPYCCLFCPTFVHKRPFKLECTLPFHTNQPSTLCHGQLHALVCPSLFQTLLQCAPPHVNPAR